MDNSVTNVSQQLAHGGAYNVLRSQQHLQVVLLQILFR